MKAAILFLLALSVPGCVESNGPQDAPDSVNPLGGPIEIEWHSPGAAWAAWNFSFTSIGTTGQPSLQLSNPLDADLLAIVVLPDNDPRVAIPIWILKSQTNGSLPIEGTASIRAGTLFLSTMEPVFVHATFGTGGPSVMALPDRQGTASYSQQAAEIDPVSGGSRASLVTQSRPLDLTIAASLASSQPPLPGFYLGHFRATFADGTQVDDESQGQSLASATSPSRRVASSFARGCQPAGTSSVEQEAMGLSPEFVVWIASLHGASRTCS